MMKMCACILRVTVGFKLRLKNYAEILKFYWNTKFSVADYTPHTTTLLKKLILAQLMDVIL